MKRLILLLLLFALPAQAAPVSARLATYGTDATIDWTYDDVTGAISSVTVTILRQGCTVTIEVRESTGTVLVNQTFLTTRTFNVPNGIARRLTSGGRAKLVDRTLVLGYAR